MKQFQEENGHLCIRDARLSKWLSYQRHHSKNLSSLQRHLLESIGHADSAKRKDRHKHTWDAKFAELKGIFDQVGFVRTPTRPLACWLCRQKKHWALGKLTSDRCDRLKSLGVSPQENMKKPSITQEQEKLWEENFSMLKNFHEKHEHTRAKTNDNPQLGRWVAGERRKYQEWCVTCEERTKKLNSLNSVSQ